MDRNPKILIVVDEPGLMVDMFFELEGRGFAVEPVKLSHSSDMPHRGIDVAIFDLHQQDKTASAIATRLRGSGIPLVVLGNGVFSDVAGMAGTEIFMPKPVDYDRLAGVLSELSGRSCNVAHASGTGMTEVPLARS